MSSKTPVNILKTPVNIVLLCQTKQADGGRPVTRTPPQRMVAVLRQNG